MAGFHPTLTGWFCPPLATITFLLFYIASKYRLLKLCKSLLLVASLFFYGYWKISYFYLIVVSMLVNFSLAYAIEKYHRKVILWAAIIFNLGLLGYFKYLTFVLDNLKSIFPLTPFTVNVSIPLGISFYTFQQITYIMDVYKRKTKTFSLGQYMLFVTFFPQLIAGPIVHYQEMMPQFNRVRTYIIKYRNLFEGSFFFLAGLFQKVVIADYLSPIANTGFQNAASITVVEAWSALFAYAFQIYFDFAGYSNMAIGLGLLFNIRLPTNFNSPYQATSIVDFWRRWHITLSHFLRDYVYIPLGGNRNGVVPKYINLLLTMLIGGFWHGAGWTFVVWGGYHGILLAINHMLDSAKIRFPVVVARISTFVLVAYGWVFFKSANWAQVSDMTFSLLGKNGLKISDTYFLWKNQIITLLIVALVAFFAPNAAALSKKIKPNISWLAVFFVIFLCNILYLNRESAFLYFQF